MGFHRRARQANRQASPELSALLGVLAARQAVSPTALAVTGATPVRDESVHPAISPFIARSDAADVLRVATSFHPGVSASVLSFRKPL